MSVTSALLDNFGREMRELVARLGHFSRLDSAALISIALRIHDQDAQERASLMAACDRLS
jgi:hypothetical protein